MSIPENLTSCWSLRSGRGKIMNDRLEGLWFGSGVLGRCRRLLIVMLGDPLE